MPAGFPRPRAPGPPLPPCREAREVDGAPCARAHGTMPGGTDSTEWISAASDRPFSVMTTIFTRRSTGSCSRVANPCAARSSTNAVTYEGSQPIPRAISPIEMPSVRERRTSVLMTPGDSFVRAPSAAIFSACSPSSAIRRRRSKASSASPTSLVCHRLFDISRSLSIMKYPPRGVAWPAAPPRIRS